MGALSARDHWLGGGLIALIIGCTIIFIIFKHLYYTVLFMPDPEKRSYRRTFAGKDYLRKIIPFRNGTIDTLLFRNNPGKKVVFYCHGNGGSIGTRGYVIELMTRFNLNTFLFDYRGYGYSEGKPTEVTFKQDALVAYDYLCTIFDPQDIIIWGESLGGSVATYTASRRKCHKLVVMSSYASIRHVLNYTPDLNKFLKFGINLVLLDGKKNIPSEDWIARVKVPTAIVHSKEDDLIPFHNGKQLYNRSKALCKIFIPISGSHVAPVFKNKDFKNLYTFLFDNAPTPNTSEFGDVQQILDQMD